MTKEAKYRCVGKVFKPHGLRGEFILFLESDFPEWIAKQKRFFVEERGQMVVWPVESARFHQRKLILKVAALADRNAVEAARDRPLYLPDDEARAANEDPDYFFNSDLIGLRVEDVRTGESYGRVVTVYEGNAQNLLEIRQADGKIFLFPFTKALVKDIDLENGLMKVTMLEGLIDCNEPSSRAD